MLLPKWHENSCDYMLIVVVNQKYGSASASTQLSDALLTYSQSDWVSMWHYEWVCVEVLSEYVCNNCPVSLWDFSIYGTKGLENKNGPVLQIYGRVVAEHRRCGSNLGGVTVTWEVWQ